MTTDVLRNPTVVSDFLEMIDNMSNHPAWKQRADELRSPIQDDVASTTGTLFDLEPDQRVEQVHFDGLPSTLKAYRVPANKINPQLKGISLGEAIEKGLAKNIQPLTDRRSRNIPLAVAGQKREVQKLNDVCVITGESDGHLIIHSWNPGSQPLLPSVSPQTLVGFFE